MKTELKNSITKFVCDKIWCYLNFRNASFIYICNPSSVGIASESITNETINYKYPLQSAIVIIYYCKLINKHSFFSFNGFFRNFFYDAKKSHIKIAVLLYKSSEWFFCGHCKSISYDQVVRQNLNIEKKLLFFLCKTYSDFVEQC